MSKDKEELQKHLENVQTQYSKAYDAFAATVEKLIAEMQDGNNKIGSEHVAGIFIASRRMADTIARLIPEETLTLYRSILTHIKTEMANKNIEPPDELKGAFEDNNKKEWLN